MVDFLLAQKLEVIAIFYIVNNTKSPIFSPRLKITRDQERLRQTTKAFT